MAKRYNILTRCLAALALLFVYVASTSAILVGGTTTSAQARGGRGGGGEEAIAAADAASIAAAVVASMAAEVMAVVMVMAWRARGRWPAMLVELVRPARLQVLIQLRSPSPEAEIGDKIKGVPVNSARLFLSADRSAT